MCLVRVVISICLFLVICWWICESRLFIWVIVGCILIFGLISLVGCIICLMICLVCFVLQGFGVVEMKMVCGFIVFYFLKCSGWLFSVEGRWKLYFIRVFLCEWLFLNIVLICGMLMCDLLIISSELVGRQLQSVGGGLLGVCLERQCEQFLMLLQQFSLRIIFRLKWVCCFRCCVFISLLLLCRQFRCFLSLVLIWLIVFSSVLCGVMQWFLGQKVKCGSLWIILLVSGLKVERFFILLLNNLI